MPTTARSAPVSYTHLDVYKRQVLDEADEIVLVDVTPDELLARLKAGKVYLPQQAERAAQNFFRKGNLIALREIALRRTCLLYTSPTKSR